MKFFFDSDWPHVIFFLTVAIVLNGLANYVEVAL